MQISSTFGVLSRGGDTATGNIPTTASPLLYLGLALALITGVLAAPAPADAAVTTDTNLLSFDGVTGRDTITSTNVDSEVWAMESVGSTLLVGGKFKSVRDRSAAADASQSFLAAFDANTGEFIPWFRPQVDGPVYDIKSVGNNQVIIAGEFTAVNDQPGTAGLARINLADGSVDTGFSSSVSGGPFPVVRSIAVTNTHIYAGGGFSTYVGPDGRSRSVGGLIKISRSNGALAAGFSADFGGAGVWGVAYNTELNRLFAAGFFTEANDEATHGVAVLNPDSGANLDGFTPKFPAAYTGLAAAFGPLMHDVETAGNRVIFTTKHHRYMVMDASTGSLIGSTSSNGTQRVELSRDGKYAYVGCHCANSGYLRVVNLSTGATVAASLKNVKGTAGVWAVEELDNGCVWTGGALTYDSSRSSGVYNMLRLCDSASPRRLTGGLTAPDLASPPTTPGTPQLDQHGSSVHLTWPASSGGQQLTYIVYRDGEEVGRTGTNRFEDLLVPTGIHQWSVAAMKLGGQPSEPSPLSEPIEIGTPTNIAPQYSFQASPGADGTSPAALIDGNKSTYWYPESNAETNDWYFQFDFGREIPIDYVLVHESDVQTARLGLAAASVKLSPDAFPNIRDEAAVSAPSALRVDHYYKPVVRLDVAARVRGMRLDAYSNFGQAIDEFEVYTTAALPRPATPAADSVRPSAPKWQRIRVLSDQRILEWGGASDDQGITSYEVWKDDSLVATTSQKFIPMSSASESSQSYTIVAVDQAGNRSLTDTAVISTGKTATQSSTYPGATADRAVDGNTDGTWRIGSVSNTANESEPWWQVDLGEVADISSIRLFNRTDCCSSRLNHVNVFISEQPFDADATIASLTSDAKVHRIRLGDGALGESTTVPVERRGRYVRVALDTTGYLGLAEVEVVAGRDVGAVVVDTERPSRPTKLAVTSTDGAASLTWTAATDNVGVVSYDVYRVDPDGSPHLVDEVEGTEYIDESVTVGQTYKYFLKAVDAAGNTSWRNGAITVTILGGDDNERPSRPTKLAVTSADGAASLTWTAATDNVGVVGYRVYRVALDGTQTQIAEVSETSYTDVTVTPGEVYNYFLKAVDAAGNSSWRNGLVSVAIVGEAATDSCTFTRDGTNATVEWNFAATADEVIIERSVGGSQFWWRGRTSFEDQTWTDSDRTGELSYQVSPKVGRTKGSPVSCSAN